MLLGAANKTYITIRVKKKVIKVYFEEIMNEA